MAGFLPDTSCIVAAVCAWHPYHEPAASEIERRLNTGEPMLLAAPALVESYAVLTRLPPPHRVSPLDALALLEGGFMETGRTVALEADASARSCARRKLGVAGGRTYDAVIAACAVAGPAQTLLTFNAAHFASLSVGGVQIVVPGAHAPWAQAQEAGGLHSRCQFSCLPSTLSGRSCSPSAVRWQGSGARLDLFGVLVLAFAAGNAGGIARDVLIGAVPSRKFSTTGAISPSRSSPAS